MKFILFPFDPFTIFHECNFSFDTIHHYFTRSNFAIYSTHLENRKLDQSAENESHSKSRTNRAIESVQVWAKAWLAAAAETASSHLRRCRAGRPFSPAKLSKSCRGFAATARQEPIDRPWCKRQSPGRCPVTPRRVLRLVPSLQLHRSRRWRRMEGEGRWRGKR